MNVTIKIDDELCRQARHRAVDADLSLSGWVAHLIEREVNASASKGATMAELLAMDDDYDLMDFIPDRKAEPERPIEFP